eukprot:gb/GEZN01010864.1/.p1 GENE.gb/GEZN01010864.1/~~gb/GEZN01010864.1/.p1  ORF type:complete len:268 (+),score=64.57 gb/GEZN01010864.1/:98-901(+)
MGDEPARKRQNTGDDADAPMEGKTKLKFNEVCQLTFAEQAQFFMNAFWAEMKPEEAEQIWKWHQVMLQLDSQQFNALPVEKRGGKEEWSEGSSLDEFWSHKFLETQDKTLTVVAFRKEFKEIDINFDNRMAMIEYLLFHYQRELKFAWANATELLKRPQGTNEDLKLAQKALKEVQEEIAKIEKEKASLEKKAELPGVKGKNGQAMLAQLLAADQTELNRKTVTAEAAVRKAQKATGQKPQGALWWISRQLTEAKKYKPKRSGGSSK